jgi:poly-beta-1,6-N-acetyl-D-glucosamine biosynthesis protein PgaD
MAIKHGWPLPEGKILNRMMLGEARKYYTIVLLALLLGFAIFIIWKNYNKRRFGSLRRRTFRPPVSKEELVEKFALDNEIVDRLQNDRVIALEKNIIPEKMGMRR